MPNQPTFLVVLDQSIMGKGERGGGGGEGGLFNFLPIKKRGDVILYPDPGTRLREGLLEMMVLEGLW